MTDRSFVVVENGDIHLKVAVQGTGPLILCVHGWPELWYSWRHQMDHFAARGFQVAALNVRGYEGSSNPPEVEAYTLREITGDVAAVIDTLGNGSAVLFGHDWGAPIVYNTARLHPEKVSAVVGLSVPYFPVGPNNPLDRWRALYTGQGKFFYQVYFDDNRGSAEAELAADSLDSIKKIYYSASGEAKGADFIRQKSADQALLDGLIAPDPFPAWCQEEDLRVYADAMDASGWHGPLNRYRAQPFDALDIGQLPNPELGQPVAFIGGEFDVVRGFAEGVDPYDFADAACNDFRGTTVVPGAGHWVQQEAPELTNDAIEAFLDSL